MNTNIVADRIRSFLAQQFPATKNVSDDDLLLRNSLIDSLCILEVVTFLEKEFAIIVSDEELLPENFESVSRLSHFVRQKTIGAA